MEGAHADERFAHLPTRPGKIIAVHLSYTSRAQQRARHPKAPSYFLKPSSSVAPSGAHIERPHGTELLAFEGEIALVIGTGGTHITRENAWSHVGWVTAANDFGLYDLRSNDKGSNLRNKGRDGYTPLGPHCIPANTLDPEHIRIRTWVNGTLAQEDTSAGMIFSLTQILADLSQHLTFETGDVILTGTPAGSSVVNPGDTIEVEVDAPTAPGAPTSGRLTTTVINGTGPAFDPALGSLPTITDQQREEAWGSRHAAGLPPHGLSDELRTKLEKTPVAGLSQQLRKRGLNNTTIDGVHPLHPDKKIVGTAKTLRFVPGREDLFTAHGGGYNAQKRCFDSVTEGEVIIIEARGETGSGTLGDILAIRAHANKCAGIITDGGVRDHDAVKAVGIPVYTAGPHPAVLGRKHVPWETDVAVACGGTTILPGDIIVADADGVIVIPPHLANEIADAALEQENIDTWIANKVTQGHRIEGLFPMNSHWRAQYETETSTGS